MNYLTRITLACLAVAGCAPFAQAQAPARSGAALRVSPAVRARIRKTHLDLSGKPDKPSFKAHKGALPPVFNDPNAGLSNAKSIDDFIEKMPDWQATNKPLPDKSSETPAGEETQTVDGRKYNISRTKYSITETPKEIVTFAPVNGFFLGSIVQEQGLALGLGSIQEVPVPATKRAPLKVTTDLPMGANFRDIANPSATTTSSAIGDLMQKGSKIKWGGSRTFNVVDNFSEEQTALSLGLDARYMTVSLKGSFKSDRYNSRHTVSAAFVEKAFTAQADFEGRSRREAFFRPNFVLADAQQLVNQGYIRPTNLPAYIKSVTYGRVMLFNLTSTLSEKEMSAALALAVNGGTYEVNADAAFSQKVKDSKFDLTVTTIGGPQNGLQALVPAAGFDDVLAVMHEYLSEPATLSTMVPISYTANTLRENKLAALSMTTEYTVTKYTANPIGERYKVKMWVEVLASDDGVADHTFEVYGSLRVNGDTWWEIPSSEAKANKKEKGQILNITEDQSHIIAGKDFTFDYFYAAKPQFKFNLLLRDWDKVSSDETWCKLDQTIDLRQWSGKEATWVNQHNGMGGKLHMKVERTEYL